MNYWQRAFILHSYPYNETSLLIDFFVESKGRLALVAKGARGKRSPQKGILQPFTPLIIQYSGSGQVKTLRQVEAISLTLPFVPKALYSAFYVNELVQRVIFPEMETRRLFSEYLECLQALATEVSGIERTLRRFEFALLENLGYKIDEKNCDNNGKRFEPGKIYLYQSDLGFVETFSGNAHGFTGALLQQFAEKRFSDEAALRAAKHFTRQALLPYVGTKPFKSRELFRKTAPT